jgi:glutathione S-transferase
MRARMALLASGITIELREVALKSKPDALLAVSKKATVPVLVTGDTVIDESIDIMHWALKQSDPHNWLSHLNEAQTLIHNNDNTFKHWLDHYKYADYHPEQSEQDYRQQGEITLALLETRLHQHSHLCTDHATLADIALFPFIRQFAGVDANWFATSPYPRLRSWLTTHIESDLFQTIMHKYQPWQDNDDAIYFPPKE